MHGLIVVIKAIMEAINHNNNQNNDSNIHIPCSGRIGHGRIDTSSTRNANNRKGEYPVIKKAGWAWVVVVGVGDGRGGVCPMQNSLKFVKNYAG